MRPGTPIRTSAPSGLGITTSVALNNDFEDAFNSDYQRLGWQYDLFKLNIPMAWAITKGNEDVTIAIGDGLFHYPDPSPSGLAYITFPQHPDITPRQFGSSTGNFFWLSEVYRSLSEPLAVYGSNDGLDIDENFPGTGLFADNEHGFSIMSLAISRENGEGMVGVAPNIRAVGFNLESNTAAHKIDMDGLSNDIIKVPDVETISALVDEASFKTDVQSGIVAIVGAGNDVHEYVTGSLTTPSSLSCTEISTPYLRMTGPRALAPASTVWDDIGTKIITVGNVSNGQLTETPCGLYMDGNGWEYSDNRNYSPGREKFPAPGSLRANERKQLAFMDLVVPKNEISASLSFVEGNYNNTVPKFRHGDAATSQAVAQVGGVVALMRSVNRYLGVPLNANGLPLDGTDVHKKAYNILTFTARKVEDNGRNLFSYPRKEDVGGSSVDVSIILPGHPCWDFNLMGGYYDDNLLTANEMANPQFNYVVQTYDNLKRSWAQRMGFGMVDAYRAVAHSIPMKASYKYQQSTTLVHGYALNGRNFVHFGSKVNEQLDLAEDRNNSGSQQNIELNVLEWGGADLPGENHNNQGVTRLQGTTASITVTIPQNFVATIDGIVKTDDNLTNRTITTSAASGSTNDHGLILITGMLDGVQLKGRMKISDLLVNPLATTLTGITVQNHGNTSDPLTRRGSEVFGTVTLKNDAFLTVDRNAVLTLQPGGVIDMQGNQNIVIKDGASLVMEYPSTIKGTTGRQVVVEKNGKLIIKAKPSADRLWRTELLAAVDVKEGGQLIVEEDALLQLGNVPNPVYVEYGGLMQCKPGSHVIIPNGRTVLCAGKLIAVGEDQHQVSISSDLTNCGDFVSQAAASISAVSIAGGTVSKSILDLKYCTVDNVSIWAMDMPTAPVEHCVFRTSSKNSIRTMFFKLASPQPSYVILPAELTDFSMLDCRFIDREGDVDVNQWRGDDDYKVSGVVLNGLRNVTVEQSFFTFLMQGVGTRLCDNVVVTKNYFSASDYGLYDDGSTVLFCNNICDRTERGNALTLSRTSRTIDNTYVNVWNGVRGESTAQQYVRNNSIADFREGVFADNSPFVLQQQEASASANIHCPSGNLLLENGYNNFISDDPDNRESEFLNFDPLGSGGKRLKEQQRDISIKGNAVVGVYSGYNKFSVESGYHLYKEDTPLQIVPVSYNQWNGPSGMAVRYNSNISPSGSVLNVEDDINKSCDVLYGCSSAGGGLACMSNTYNNDGHWATLASTDPFLDTVYTHARQDMVNSSYDVMCRRVKAHDALEAATLGQQKTTKLQQLISDYGAMAASGTNPDEVRSLAMVLKGEAHERLGETSHAITAYTAVTTSYPLGSDAEVSTWRLHYLSASTTGTVGGVAYENAQEVYRQQVLDDMRASSVGTGPHKRGDSEQGYAGIPSGTTLQSLVPNPSDGDVTITYSVGERSMVRVVVVDALGRELGVVNAGIREAGEYSVKWDGHNLSSGMYAVRLECGGQVYSLPLVIVK